MWDGRSSSLHSHSFEQIRSPMPAGLLRYLLIVTVVLVARYACAQAPTVQLQLSAATCVNNGACTVLVQGGTPPYSYLWDDAVTDSVRTDLAPSSYHMVTVTDALGESAVRDFVVELVDVVDLLPEVFNQDRLAPCEGQCNGGIYLRLPRVVGGYSFTTTPALGVAVHDTLGQVGLVDETHLVYEFYGGCAEQVVDIEASIPACASGQGTISILPAAQEPQVVLLNNAGACSSAGNGTVQIQVTAPPDAYEWSWATWFSSDAIPGSYYGNVTVIPGSSETATLYGAAPGGWVFYYESSEQQGSVQGPCYQSFPFMIPDLGDDCGTIQGLVHYETDADCVQEADERGMGSRLVRAEPGPFFGITDGNGSYSIEVPYGSYTVQQVEPAVVQLCPAEIDPVDVSEVTPISTLDFADSLLIPLDLQVSLWNTTARPGFEFRYDVYLDNPTDHPVQQVTIVLTYDTMFSVVSATPGLVENTPGQATWTLPAFDPFSFSRFSLILQVPADVSLIGATVSAQVDVTSAALEPNMENNTTQLDHVIFGSFDPNDKQAFTSSRFSSTSYFLDSDNFIDYLIRFQNTGTDTAFTVMVVDTLSPLLDIGTLHLLGASHPFTPSLSSTRALRFKFNNILLPDSGTNAVASQGYVAFRIAPVLPLQTGTTLDNAADIYFDFNPPVRTNTAILEVASGIGIAESAGASLRVFPCPASDIIRVQGLPDQHVKRFLVLAADGRPVAERPAGRDVDVSELSPGLYFLKAETSTGATLLARFIKD